MCSSLLLNMHITYKSCISINNYFTEYPLKKTPEFHKLLIILESEYSKKKSLVHLSKHTLSIPVYHVTTLKPNFLKTCILDSTPARNASPQIHIRNIHLLKSISCKLSQFPNNIMPHFNMYCKYALCFFYAPPPNSLSNKLLNVIKHILLPFYAL